MWIAKLYDHRELSLLLLTLFWVLVGLGAGVQEYLAGQALGYTIALPDALAWPLIAAVCWIPLTLGIVHLGRHFPLRLPGRPFVWALHLVASLSASFVLNLNWSLLLHLADLLPDGTSWQVWTLSWSLRWLHINALVYWVILGVAYGLPAFLRLSTTQQEAEAAPLPSFVVPSGKETLTIPAHTVDWIEAAGDYVYLHCGEAKYLLRERMKNMEKRLAHSSFVRIHRSTIVNVDRVQSISHLSHGDYEVLLESGVALRASRTRTNRLTHLHKSA